MYGSSNQQMGYGPGFAAAYQNNMTPQFAYPQQDYPQVGMYEISGQLPQEFYGQPGGVFTPTTYAAPAAYSPYLQGQYPQVGLWEIGAQQQALQPTTVLPPMQAPAVTMRAPQLIPGTRLTPKIPSQDRVLWLGFRYLNITSGSSQTVTSRPQDTFAPRKVVVPSSVAPNFDILDIRIGAISQLSSADPIPAEAFIPNASLTDVHFDTAQISQDVVFSVNNISNAAASFRATMNGFVVRA